MKPPTTTELTAASAAIPRSVFYTRTRESHAALIKSGGTEIGGERYTYFPQSGALVRTDAVKWIKGQRKTNKGEKE